MFACVCLVSSCGVEHPVEALLQLAGDFSPRFEMVRPRVVLVEIGGLGRLLGTPHEIGAAFCRVADDRGMLVTVGIAATHTAALLLAMHPATHAPAQPVLTVVSPGREATALAALPLSLLAVVPGDRLSNDDVMYLRRRADRGGGDEVRGAHDARDMRPARDATAIAMAAATATPSTASASATAATTTRAPSGSAPSVAMRGVPPEALPGALRETPPGTPRGTAPGTPSGKTRGWRGRGYSQHYRLAPAPLPPDEPSASSSASSTSHALPSTSSHASPSHASPSTSSHASPSASHDWPSASRALSSTSHVSPSASPASASASASTGSASAAWNHAVHPASAFDPADLAVDDERRDPMLEVLRRWGLKTLGEFARLPAADVFTRLGGEGLALQQIARGQDARPLIPTTADEPFEASLALEWPIDTLEPLSFVLTRLFEPLCARLERCDRGAAVLQVTLQLVTRRTHVRRLELPAPMRDPKVLRTLVLLDLESHPPDAGIDRITIAVDPTPGRIVQHSLLTRALPSPEQLSTLTARLTAVMGEGRVGAPVLLDTYRPEAFEMRRFAVDDTPRHSTRRRHAFAGHITNIVRPTPARTSPSALAADETARALAPPKSGLHPPHLSSSRATSVAAVSGLTALTALSDVTPIIAAVAATSASAATAAPTTIAVVASVAAASTSDAAPMSSAGRVADHGERAGGVSVAQPHFVLRRFRHEVPARVRVEDGRPVHVTPHGLPGGDVLQAAGPWRTSGEWWKSPSRLQPVSSPPVAASTSSRPRPSSLTESWDRDEWDVALSNGSLYRIHLDRRQDRWFADAELD